jgi:hypothetical protein
MEKSGFRYERNGTFMGFEQVIYRLRREEWKAEYG